MADMKAPTYRNLPDVVKRVRDSHQAVIDGIATAVEKHRLEMNAKRDTLKQHNALKAELPSAKT